MICAPLQRPSVATFKERTSMQITRTAIALTSDCLTARAYTQETETKKLNEICTKTLAEGGGFVWHAGGDKPAQVDAYLHRFKQRFPDPFAAGIFLARHHSHLVRSLVLPSSTSTQTLQMVSVDGH